MSEVIRAIRDRFGLSVKDIAEKVDVSETTVRKWLAGGGITSDKQQNLARALGFDNWGQLQRFLIPEQGDVYVLRHFTQDVSRVWEHYLGRDASPIFETKIALSGDRPSALTHGSKANTEARRRIMRGALTLHRVEQPRSVKRLAELAANAHYFKQHTNYAVKIVPPVSDEDLFTYPNLLRFGKKVLVLGRTHKFGTPAANAPLVMMCGDAAEELGDHLERAIWDDSNAKVFSSLDEDERMKRCREWAARLDPEMGISLFDKTYRELYASTHDAEKLRI